uniref:Uncharacterized protein n=1 Tax=Anguilla anguilla TaxID=7936 RepID=A0A0E9TXL5_ANGAN
MLLNLWLILTVCSAQLICFYSYIRVAVITSQYYLCH